MPVNNPIIVHTFEHCLIALAAAQELDIPVTLQSAPDAIFYAGGLYIHTMFSKARAQFPEVKSTTILDANDAQAEAISAMQMGHTHIRSRAPAEIRKKLADIAAKHGILLYDGGYESLDLEHVRDTKGACRKWLEEKRT